MISARGLLLFILAGLLIVASNVYAGDQCKLEATVAWFAAKYRDRGDPEHEVQVNLAESLELFGSGLARARVNRAVRLAYRYPKKSRRQVELLALRSCRSKSPTTTRRSR